MWYNPFYSIVHFRVTTLRYRPKEAVPIEPKQQRHISTDGVKTTAGATGQPGAPAPKNKKKPKKRRSIIGMIFSFIGCMLCLCIMAASVGGVLLSMYIVQVTADDAETLDLDNQKNRQTSIVYDINGNEYASLSRNENRIWRELSAMPENLQNAVIAIEDKNFRTEPGINLKGTIGAALNAFTGNRIWGTNRGASTLEQQLIKNLTGDNEQDNMRKVREIFRALGLDNKYSKETILTVQGGIIMQNRQIDGHGLYLSLLAGLAVLCLAAALVWFARPQPETAAPRYLLKDSGGHVALYTADGIGPLATYDDLYTRLLPESDVLALQQGVFVADEAELQRRLEDYGL